jgi:hypothetical protein
MEREAGFYRGKMKGGYRGSAFSLPPKAAGGRRVIPAVISLQTQRKMKNGWCWWGGRPWPRLSVGGRGGPPHCTEARITELFSDKIKGGRW